MSEEKSGEGPKVNVGLFPGAAEAVQALAKPVYDDGLKPTVVQAGKLAETLLRVVNAAFMPIRSLVYGVEQLEPIVSEGIAKRLAGKEESDVQTPPTYVFVPAVEALRTRASVDELREMFLNLIAASMDKARADAAHPSFVEVLKQITPDEARILTLFFDRKAINQWWIETKFHNDERNTFDYGPSFSRLSLMGTDADCEHAESVPAYIENLLRLGLIYETRPWACHLRTEGRLRQPGVDKVTGEPWAGERFSEMIERRPEIFEVVRRFGERDDLLVWTGEVRLTELGKAFCRSCVGWEDPNGLLTPGSGEGQLMHNQIRV